MQTLFKLASFLPLPMLRGLGFVLGIVAWLGSARYRRDFDTQWSQAMHYWSASLPSKNRPSKIVAIGQSGLLISELPRIWCRPQTAIEMRDTGFSQVHEALALGKGLIILTPHLGAFELAARRIAREFPLTVLYRPARKPYLEGLFSRFRESEGVRPVPANAQGVRHLLRSLRKGGAIGLLPDQVPSDGDGVIADFFGRPAYTMTLPMRLAHATGASLVWATALRTPGGWSLSLELWDANAAGVEKHNFSNLLGEITIEAAVSAMNQEIERRIARAPEQYLWAYDRYKRVT